MVDLLRVPVGERPHLVGDFSLNIANVVTSQLMLDSGLDSFSPSYDLNAQQIVKLARQVDCRRMEIIAYSHLPVFHMEHCVFCRFLSDGTDNTNCGHPCEKHKVEIRDQQGRMHPVLADVGCRNTVFGAEAQFSARHLKAWVDSGIRHFRLEFVHESPQEVFEVSSAIGNALGSGEFSELDRVVAIGSSGGLTEGSLFVPK